MWPKAISQLIELAPHVSRLLPMADRFFQSKSADADASRTAMEQMAEGLRGDLGQVTASHAGLYRQLNEHAEKMAALSTDVRAGRAVLDRLDERMAQIEKQLIRLMLLGSASIVLLIAVIVVVLLRH
jgi:septal ring factor EnvC (AmiA/AmiB activator)